MSVNYSQVYAAYRGTTELGRIYEGDLLVWEKPQGDLTFRIWRSVPVLTQEKFVSNVVDPIDMGSMADTVTVNTWMHDGYDRRVYTTKFVIARSVGINTLETQIDSAVSIGKMSSVRSIQLLADDDFVARRVVKTALRLRKDVIVKFNTHILARRTVKIDDVRIRRNAKVNLKRRIVSGAAIQIVFSHADGAFNILTVKELYDGVATYALARLQSGVAIGTIREIFPIVVKYDPMMCNQSATIETTPRIMLDVAGHQTVEAHNMSIDFKSEVTAIAEVYTPWKYPFWDDENNLVIRQAYSASLSSGTLTIN